MPNMKGEFALSFLMISLGCYEAAVACSPLASPPWQKSAVWPPKETSVPLNTKVHVRIPANYFSYLVRTEATEFVPLLSGRIVASIEEPVSKIARSLSLHEATDEAGALVQTTWHATADPRDWLFELVPSAPLRPQTEYAIMMDSKQGREHLGTIRTGLHKDDTPPVWLGIKQARYMPPVDACSGAHENCGCYLRSHGSLAELMIHEATDEGAVRYAVWLARHGEEFRYEVRPWASIVSREGKLILDNPPMRMLSVRIGVRAVDAAGNMSPPSEVELELK